MIQGAQAKKGFALPTILIASVVMLTVLLFSISNTTAVRNAILNQYYSQLAQVAGEAGVAYAQACLAQNDNIPTWSDDNPLTPSTDCTGAQIPGTSTIEALIVAGGGGGGNNMGGGGGGGGVIYNASIPISTGSFPIVVGDGGIGAAAGVSSGHTSVPGTNGGGSSFKGLTAIGGGRGGSSPNGLGLNINYGASGGSGGGASGYNDNSTAAGVVKGGAGTPGQGYAGGNQGTAYYSGGGGGAGGAGASGNSTAHGGPGVANDILGTNYYWGGGGGGSGYSINGGNGGIGGGGGGAVGSTSGGAGLNNGSAGGGGSTSAQTNTPGGNGGANTGGGGGGGSHYFTNNKGGDGGSGIVIISYPTGTLTATGGSVTTSGGNTIHKFTSNGTFVITEDTGSICPDDVRCSVSVNDNVRSSFSVGVPTVGANSIKALVVGGGGGGAGAGSGGGGGGYMYTPALPISTGSYPVTVGDGGAGGPTSIDGTKGQDSIFSSITAEGGGYGVSHGAGKVSGSGGSGGGGGLATGGLAPLNGKGSQGNDGGLGFIESGWVSSLAGGGGAGSAGSNACNSAGCGNGGNGKINSITGSPVYYAAGGGAGEINGGYVGGGGLIGGGSGKVNAAGTNGLDGTGSGGGGGSYNGSYFNGGNGGSGIVVVSYPTGSLTATGGTVTTFDGNTIHKFTSSGTFDVTAVNAKNTIPNSGYVEVTRKSNGEVWRTYTQPTAQPAVISGLCSGEATSALGWNTATKLSPSDSFPISSASTISISSDKVNPGPMYFRKDFSVTKAGTYTLQVKADDLSDVSIDNTLITSTSDSSRVYSVSKSLTAGCHTFMVKLTNNGIAKNYAKLTLSLKDSSGSPLVVTDTSWRVAAGATKHFSQVGYYADPSSWTPVRVYQDANTMASTWNTTSGVPAGAITTTHSYTAPYNYPADSYTYFRDNQTVTVTSPTDVLVTYICDDGCNIYLDGQVIASGIGAVATTTLTLTEGSHEFGMSGYNINLGLSDFALAVKRISDGSALTFTNPSWEAANFWEQTNNASNYYSYDNKYTPNPSPTGSIAAKVLVVGGGGGGGGNCSGCGGAGGGGAGGVVYIPSYPLQVGATVVTVGAGGVGGLNNNTITGTGYNGSISSFGSLKAIGGGGGSPQNGVSGVSGGSGGGGSGGSSPAAGAMGFGLVGQGFNGSSGWGANMGGGGGGAGVASSAGNGGAGIANSITGSSIYYAGGGGGGAYNTATPGIGGTGGGGAGGKSTVSAISGTANTGGGAGGAGTGNSGATGGSGVVIISYPTGSMTATGGTVTTSGGNTIHRFTSSGTFSVTSIN